MAAAQQQCAALQQELSGRPAQEEMAALRQRVEALRLLVDSREEEEADAMGGSSGHSAPACYKVLPQLLASDLQGRDKQQRQAGPSCRFCMFEAILVTSCAQPGTLTVSSIC